jgi:hypothetical protein
LVQAEFAQKYSHVTTTMQNDALERLDNVFKSYIKAKLNNDPTPG